MQREPFDFHCITNAYQHGNPDSDANDVAYTDTHPAADKYAYSHFYSDMLRRRSWIDHFPWECKADDAGL
jgi:hypothetical protein